MLTLYNPDSEYYDQAMREEDKVVIFNGGKIAMLVRMLSRKRVPGACSEFREPSWGPALPLMIRRSCQSDHFLSSPSSNLWNGLERITKFLIVLYTIRLKCPERLQLSEHRQNCERGQIALGISFRIGEYLWLVRAFIYRLGGIIRAGVTRDIR